MSEPLVDFKGGITQLAHLALRVNAGARGETMQAIAREVLHEWALREHHKYSLYARGLVANGLQAELPGLEVVPAGKRRTDAGMGGKLPEDAGTGRREHRR